MSAEEFMLAVASTSVLCMCTEAFNKLQFLKFEQE